MAKDLLPEVILQNLPLTYYVIDLDSYKIKKTNDSEIDGINSTCYRFLFDKDEPCEMLNGKCICRQLFNKNDKVTYIIENKVGDKKSFFRANASIIDESQALVVYEEITEVVSIQKELKIQNKRLERAETLASFGYWEFSVDDNFIFASKGAMRIYGIDSPKLKLSEARMCALPEFREELEKQMVNLILNDEPYNIQYKINRQTDGAVRYIHSVAEFRKEKRMVFGVINDITQNARAEEALSESEHNLKLLFENMNSAFAFHKIITNDDGKPVDYIFLDINPKFEEITGLKREDVIGKSVLELMPETEKFWIETYGEVALSGIPVSFSEFSEQINKYFEVSAYSPQKNYFAVTFTDITLRVKSEQALNESLKDLKMAQQIAKIGSWKYNPENVSYSWSEQVCEIFECDPAENMYDYSMLVKCFLPDDINLLNEKVKKALFIKTAFDIQLKINLPENRFKWIEIICQPGELTNKNEYFLSGTVQDISENKAAEEKIYKSNQLLRTVIDNIPEAIYLKDVNYRKLIANREDAIRSGFENPDQLIGTSDFDLYPPEIAKRYLEDDIRVIENGESIIDKKEILPGENGDRIILTTKIPLKNEKNEVIGLVGIGHDNTEKTQMIDDLLKAKKEAEESSRLKSLFLTNMSHEIRTPLNGILGFSNIICSGMADSSKLEYYGKIIEKSGRRLIKMVDDIIDISMLQSGQMTFSTSRFNLNALLNDVYMDSASLNPERIDIEFSLIKCDDENRVLITDKNKISLVLGNLIENAFKFTKSGKIEFGFYSVENNNVTLFVKDSGIGISEEKQKIIFEAFRQAEEGDARNFEGSGVGLAVVSGILEKLGGAISVKSQPGQGSVFYIKIPELKIQKEL